MSGGLQFVHVQLLLEYLSLVALKILIFRHEGQGEGLKALKISLAIAQNCFYRSLKKRSSICILFIDDEKEMKSHKVLVFVLFE